VKIFHEIVGRRRVRGKQRRKNTEDRRNEARRDWDRRSKKCDQEIKGEESGRCRRNLNGSMKICWSRSSKRADRLDKVSVDARSITK